MKSRPYDSFEKHQKDTGIIQLSTGSNFDKNKEGLPCQVLKTNLMSNLMETASYGIPHLQPSQWTFYLINTFFYVMHAII